MNNNTQWGNFRSDDVDGISEIYRLLKKLEVAINAGFQGNGGWTDNGTTVTLTTTTDTVQVHSQLTVGGNATAQGKIILLEDTDNGSNKITLQPPASITSDRTITLPSAAPVAEGVVKTDASGNWSYSVGYKVYTALLTQTGTDAPVATVLENTLGGTVVWSYDDVGTYSATLSGAFTVNKTWLLCMTSGNTSIQFSRIDANSLSLITYDSSTTESNNELTANAIEIRVYN